MLSCSNLRSFIHLLEQRGDLCRITTPVDPDLEVAEIHRRVIAQGGPALLFERPLGAKFPLVTNLFGTAKRVELAFGPRPRAILETIARAPEVLMPPSLRGAWRMRSLAALPLRVGLRRSWRAPVLECEMQPPDLTVLPATKSWKEDGGRFLTLPLVHTHPLGEGASNLGIYRVQIFGSRETGMHFQIGKGGGFHLHAFEGASQPMPLNVYLGGPPALMLAAIAPLPENVPELLLASLMVGSRLGMTPPLGRFGMSGVAEAEFCLVGHVPPNIRRDEGPFGDHYGYYSLKHPYPVFRVDHMYHRRDAIFPATVVGKPCQEDFFLGNYLQTLLQPMIRLAMPTVRDLWSYGETGFHALTAAVVADRYSREAVGTMLRILGEGQLSLTKFLLGVDQPLDLQDFRAVLRHVLERVVWSRDLVVIPDTSMDSLDYAGPKLHHGSKGFVVGLGPPCRPLGRRPIPDLSGEGVASCEIFIPGCLVIDGADIDVPHVLQRLQGLDWPLVVRVDSARATVASVMTFLWTTFTRMDPFSDLFSLAGPWRQCRRAEGDVIIIDARMKSHYPDELECDPETSQRVDRQWATYGIQI